MVLIINSSVCINTVQLQPSHRGRCSGPATGCFSHQLQNVYFYCLAPAYFLFRVGSHVGCINCKQSLGSCKCRYRIWVTSTGRCKQTVKKILRGIKSESGIEACCLNPYKHCWLHGCGRVSCVLTKPFWV